MSYLRWGRPYRFVDGFSDDYIFFSFGDFMEDYGHCSDSSLVELLFRYWGCDDKNLKDYVVGKLKARLDDDWFVGVVEKYFDCVYVFKQVFLERVAEMLNVELRDKVLSDDEWWDLVDRNWKVKKE